MPVDVGDAAVRRARRIALLSLVPAPLTTAIMPAAGMRVETRPELIALAGIGIGAVVVAQALSLYRTLGSGRRRNRPGWPDLTLAVTVLASIPLAAPLGGSQWATWAWLGGSVAGSLPLLFRRPLVVAGGWVGLLAVVLIIGVIVGNPLQYGLTAVSIGAMVTLTCGLPIALWRLVADVQAGREARARLAVAEERLRFSRDVHDLVGHTLSVIAVKAELVERLQQADHDRAAAEAGQLRQLTAEALTQLRSTVDGYRGVDLAEQLDSIRESLRSAGIDCTIEVSDPPDSGAESRLLAIAAREATTNVLRHADATRCMITVDRAAGAHRVRVINDRPKAPDRERTGSGLIGMRERFAESGGTVRAGPEGDLFVFEATLPAADSVPSESS